MSKKCAKCEKSVYPIEELKCLDKIWHKACFRCFECGMTLNMKNYKGYEKQPYCNAHYPKTNFTAVADTPEMNRLAKNTQIQSQVQYHAEHEKTKSVYTAVADDPETKRIAENTQKQSLTKYKQRAPGVPLRPLDSELQRLLQAQKQTSLLKYHEDYEKNYKGKGGQGTYMSDLERILLNQSNASMVQYHKDFVQSKGKLISTDITPEMERVRKNQEAVSAVKYHAEFERNIKGSKISVDEDPETARHKQNTAISSQVEYKGHREQVAEMEKRRGTVPTDQIHARRAPMKQAVLPQEAPKDSPYSAKNTSYSTVYSQSKVEQPAAGRGVGRIADYDPANDKWGSLNSGYMPSGTNTNSWEETVPEPTHVAMQPPKAGPGPPMVPGSSSDPTSSRRLQAPLPGYEAAHPCHEPVFRPRMGQPLPGMAKVNPKGAVAAPPTAAPKASPQQPPSTKAADKKSSKKGSKSSQKVAPEQQLATPNTKRGSKVLPPALQPVQKDSSKKLPPGMQFDPTGPGLDPRIRAATPLASLNNNNNPAKLTGKKQQRGGAPVSSAPLAPFGVAQNTPRFGAQRSSRHDYTGNGSIPAAAVPLVPLGQPLNFKVHHPDEPVAEPDYHTGANNKMVQQVEPVRQPPMPAPSDNPLQGAVFRAMYDYDAQDDDEVGFKDGDLVINPQQVDAGWMIGTIQSSGMTGMLPANYVERIK